MVAGGVVVDMTSVEAGGVGKATQCCMVTRLLTTIVTGRTVIVTRISRRHISNVNHTNLTKDMPAITQEFGPHQTTAEQHTAILRLVEVLQVEADPQVRNITLTVALAEAAMDRATEALVETTAGTAVMEATAVLKEGGQGDEEGMVVMVTGDRQPMVTVATAAEPHTVTPGVEVGVDIDTNTLGTYVNSEICFVLYVCMEGLCGFMTWMRPHINGI
jgi:hypothetical protein